MRVMTFSEARKNFKTVLDQVSEDANATIITRRDVVDAVVISLEHYNSLMETVHLLSSPANANHLQRSIDQYHAGQHTLRELVNADD